MTCLICGAKCKCKRARPGLCCSCHRHQARPLKVFAYSADMGVSREAFFASMEKHQTKIDLQAIYPSKGLPTE